MGQIPYIKSRREQTQTNRASWGRAWEVKLQGLKILVSIGVMGITWGYPEGGLEPNSGLAPCVAAVGSIASS
jgi:hypothetical protein